KTRCKPWARSATNSRVDRGRSEATVSDAACVEFLQWVAPRLHLRWAGFRNVRGQVCKRLHRRIRELALPDLDAYRAYLDTHAEEWPAVDALCRVTISRFRRDRGVFDALEHDILPALAAREPEVRCWSIGCASGEEPYTLAILTRSLATSTTILATDV